MFCFSVFGIICRYHGNTHSATVPKCVLHIYTSKRTCVPSLIWKVIFPPQLLAYVVTMATHFSPFLKSFLHIYTSRPTCKPNFFWIACEMFCFSVFGMIRCYHGNAHPATVPKCVMHSYTSTWTCMPNLIWNAFPPQFVAWYAVTMATHFPLLSKSVFCTTTPYGHHVCQISL